MNPITAHANAMSMELSREAYASPQVGTPYANAPFKYVHLVTVPRPVHVVRESDQLRKEMDGVRWVERIETVRDGRRSTEST